MTPEFVTPEFALSDRRVRQPEGASPGRDEIHPLGDAKI